MPVVPSAARLRRRVAPSQRDRLLFPLDAACARVGIEPPSAVPIAASAVPEPYRTLLVHEHNMTGTLARHHASEIVARVLSTMTKGVWCTRHVVLARSDSGHPVATGAIRFRVDALSRRVQHVLRDTDTPFGRALAAEGIAFVSRPHVFLQVMPNGEMMGLFWMAEPRPLYGRRSVVLMGGVKIGDVVEVLPLAS